MLLQSVVVQNETLEFLITLQNPFAFDLEIQDIRLSTTGVPFTSHPCPVVLLPNAFQTIRVTGFASSSGKLVVQGCFVRLPDGSEAEFLLPVHDAAEEKRQRKRESTIVEMDRAMKLVGLDARPSERRKRESQILENGPAISGIDKSADKTGSRAKSGLSEEPGFLSCEVVPEQPLVRIRGTSLTHGAIMLYDGEEYVHSSSNRSGDLRSSDSYFPCAFQDQHPDHAREHVHSARRLCQAVVPGLDDRPLASDHLGGRALRRGGVRARVGSRPSACVQMGSAQRGARDPSRGQEDHQHPLQRKGWVVSPPLRAYPSRWTSS